MANTKALITTNSTGGTISRLDNNSFRKNLMGLGVLVEDTSQYSPYYFNVIRKPSELKLGGNIFEFAPPRNRFVLGTQILFEAVDSQNNRRIAMIYSPNCYVIIAELLCNTRRIAM